MYLRGQLICWLRLSENISLVKTNEKLMASISPTLQGQFSPQASVSSKDNLQVFMEEHKASVKWQKRCQMSCLITDDIKASVKKCARRVAIRNKEWSKILEDPWRRLNPSQTTRSPGDITTSMIVSQGSMSSENKTPLSLQGLQQPFTVTFTVTTILSCDASVLLSSHIKGKRSISYTFGMTINISVFKVE